MNALKQYIDLYDEHRQLVESNSAPLLNERRAEARDALSACVLPKKGSENYEHTDLSAMLATDYGINIARQPMSVNPAASFRCDVPNMSTALFFLINDAWARTDNSFNKIPEGVVIGSLRKVAAERPELLADYYGKVADMSNPMVALNTLLAQDGMVVYIPKGTVVEK
ncbi:MAG: Fe-S cluster assembly protein SufD, partial [Muribaculaceae bacterium]|nr:Fe-S cluster assembly protein SufD [Muribaculaceae bacterium]